MIEVVKLFSYKKNSALAPGLYRYKMVSPAWVAQLDAPSDWIRELTLNPLGFSPLWFEPRSGHMWESQVLLTDGQVVFLRVLRFSPTFDERSARYKRNILERAVKPKSKKKKKNQPPPRSATFFLGD